MRPSCTVFELQRFFSSKVANFNPPHAFVPPKGVIQLEFCCDIWRQKTRVSGLSCGVISVILRLAVLIQYRSVTNTQTHDDGIYRA